MIYDEGGEGSLNYEWRFMVFIGISTVVVCLIANIAGSYDEKLKELVLSYGVFSILDLIILLILEGCYQSFKWICKKM